MHASLDGQVKLCALTCQACSPDSKDTFISLIWPNLAEIWACAHKHIVCMQKSLHAWFVKCTQIGLVCSPDSIDTLLSLIRPNLAEIWALAHKHIVCMHASLRAWVKICTQRGPACSKNILISDPTQFGQDMGLCTQAHSMHAQVILCAQRGLSWYPDSVDTMSSLIWPKFAEILA